MNEQQTVTPEDPPVEVVYIQAHLRKLRSLTTLDWPPDDDLRSCCYPYDRYNPPEWERAYYLSLRDLEHSTGVTIPAGTPFSLTELTEGKLWTTGDPEAKGIDGLGGDYMEMTCLDPADEDKILTFGFWHAVQDDQDKNFEKVENAMEVIAIAATGLDLP